MGMAPSPNLSPAGKGTPRPHKAECNVIVSMQEWQQRQPRIYRERR